MKQILIGLSESSAVCDRLAPIRTALESGAYTELLIHLYSSFTEPEFCWHIARQVKDCLPDALIAGALSAGEIMEGKLMPPGSVLLSALLFETSHIVVRRYDDIKKKEDLAGRRICEDIDAFKGLKAVELLLPGTEMDTRMLFSEISNCSREVQVFGGYAGGPSMHSEVHFVFDDKGASSNALLAVFYAGEDLFIDIDRTLGWEPLGMPFRVTRAAGNHLIELDGRPAAEIYEKYLQIDLTKDGSTPSSLEFPLLVRQQKEEHLRSTIRIEPDGSIDMHGFVTEGTEIYITYGNPSGIVEKINQRLEKIRAFRPDVILLYSCLVRKAFWEDFVNMEMEPFASLASTGGFHTWGEVIREEGSVIEHNVTLLSIAMREGLPRKDLLPPVKVDDTVLRGQASLLRRLTSLIYTTMENLRRANEDLSEMNRKLTFMAEHDALTGLYNRGKTEELISSGLEEAEKTSCPLSLLMVDVDHFKYVNDTFGHETGDLVLRTIANLLQICAEHAFHTQYRKPDQLVESSFLGDHLPKVGRWGGEEFFILLPDCSSERAMEIAELVRSEVEKHSFPGAGQVTVSLGVITAHEPQKRNAVLTKVDDALYKAKNRGSNCVVKASWPEIQEDGGALYS